MRLLHVTLFLLAIFSALSACTPVSPWQKGAFAKRQMAIDPDPLEERFRLHQQASKEASSGGYGLGGGGCGCN